MSEDSPKLHSDNEIWPEHPLYPEARRIWESWKRPIVIQLKNQDWVVLQDPQTNAYFFRKTNPEQNMSTRSLG